MENGSGLLFDKTSINYYFTSTNYPEISAIIQTKFLHSSCNYHYMKTTLLAIIHRIYSKNSLACNTVTATTPKVFESCRHLSASI